MYDKIHKKRKIGGIKMPSWGIHLAIANRVINKLGKKLNEEEKDKFIFANVLPDINNGYVVKNISEVISHKLTHFEPKQYKGDYENKPGYINFYEKYKSNLGNSIILGYYTHLMTDYYFNNTTYKEYGIYDENNNRIGLKLNNGEEFIAEGEECRKIKVNDFKLFAYYLYNNEKIEIPEYNENMLEDIKNIEEINVTKEDIKEIIKYINECVEKPKIIFDETIIKNYKIYTEEELKRRVDICVDFIIENIENKL